MSQNTTMAGIPWPELTDEPNIEDAVRPLAEWIDSRIVPRFATTAERDGAITAPEAGQMCFVTTRGLQLYMSSTWVNFTSVDLVRLIQQAAQNFTNNVTTAITFGTSSQIYIPLGGHSTSSNNTRFTPPFPGRYRATGTITWASTAAGSRETFIGLNGNVVAGSSMNRSVGVAVTQGTSADATLTCNGTTDYIELLGVQSSGGTLATVVTTNTMSNLFVQYLGPAL